MWAPSVRHLRLFKYTQTTTGQNAITTKSNPVQELHVELEFNGVAKEGYLTQLQAIREAEKCAAKRFLLGTAASAG